VKIERIKNVIITLVMCPLLSAHAQTAESIPAVGTLDIDLGKAIDIALAENPTIKVADKEIELKKIADSEAWQALLPSVTATASLQHTLLAAELNLGGRKFKMGADGTNTVAAIATVSIPVFAPTVYQNMKITKEDILLAQEKARGSRLDLVRQVTKAYYAALLAKDSYEVMKKSYAVAKENYDVVNDKYKVGKVSEYDLISADVQVRSMNSSLVSTETGLSLALLQLKVLMGVTENVDLNINDNLRDYENSLTLDDGGSDALEIANNSSLRQIDRNMDMLERSSKILKTNFMPNVSFQLSGQYQSLYNTNWNVFKYDYSPSASFTIGVSVPIFTAHNWTKLKTNKMQRMQLQDTRENTLLQLRMATESYRKNMLSTVSQIESNREAVVKANKAVDISSKRYDVGRGTILELNQSETALTQAELTYNQSIYDFLANKADLDYTLGRETYLK
jgi:outer membrane protein